jgi:hypothetical protein
MYINTKETSVARTANKTRRPYRMASEEDSKEKKGNESKKTLSNRSIVKSAVITHKLA